MQNVSFGSHFEVDDLSKMAFNHKTGKKYSRSAMQYLKETAHMTAGQGDKFVLVSDAKNAKGQLLPAVLKFIPSGESQGVNEATKVISNQPGWGSQITAFMRQMHDAWSKSNVRNL